VKAKTSGYVRAYQKKKGASEATLLKKTTIAWKISSFTHKNRVMYEFIAKDAGNIKK